MELFRISPVSAAEVIAGKVLAFGILGFVDRGHHDGAAGRRARRPAPRPTRARWRSPSGCCCCASLGLGLLIAVISDSERQAVQLSLLVLLASVFFSGFVLAIDEFTPAGARARLRAARDARHPAAAGPDAARHDRRTAGRSAALGVIALVTLVAAWIVLRRGMRARLIRLRPDVGWHGAATPHARRATVRCGLPAMVGRSDPRTETRR